MIRERIESVRTHIETAAQLVADIATLPPDACGQPVIALRRRALEACSAALQSADGWLLDTARRVKLPNPEGRYLAFHRTLTPPVYFNDPEQVWQGLAHDATQFLSDVALLLPADDRTAKYADGIGQNGTTQVVDTAAASTTEGTGRTTESPPQTPAKPFRLTPALRQTLQAMVELGASDPSNPASAKSLCDRLGIGGSKMELKKAMNALVKRMKRLAKEDLVVPHRHEGGGYSLTDKGKLIAGQGGNTNY